MHTPNLFAISGLFIIASYLPLFVLLMRNSKTLIARIYAGHIFSVLIWGIGSFLIGSLNNPDLVYIIWGPAYTGVLFVPVFFYHSVWIITRDNKNWKIYLCYGQAVLFTILMFTGVLMHRKDQFLLYNSMYFHKDTLAYTLSFICWSLTAVVAHIELYLFYRKSYPEEKAQIRNLLWAFTGYFAGATNFLPAYGFQFYPYGNFLVPLHCFFIAYGIFKHQLFDINVVFKKGVAYSILIFLVSLFYLSVILTIENLLRNVWGYHSPFVSTGLAFILGIILFPLHNNIQKFVDKTIFKKTSEEIAEENVLLRQEVLKSEKLKSVATLASGMAHEIKNPLTAIKTFSEYLPQKLEDKDFLQKFSKIVGSEVNRIDALVNELMEFAKPSPVQPKFVNINELISETLNFLNSQLVKYRINIITELSSDCNTPIRVDPNKMRQALLNLFLNAIQAMRTGGTLKVRTLKGQSIEIYIEDTGCGIPPKDLTKIFDPFYSTKDDGTGLGLPITHQIIEEHGGTLSVESAVGEGSTFKITLPTGEQKT